LEWFRSDIIAAATGYQFGVVQANHSVSRRGVVRGIHFSDVPPGQAKFVYCPVGSVLDVVVDVRVGSPTFGAVESVVLDDRDRRAVLLAPGLGHAFCAIHDLSSVNYLVTAAYDPDRERTVSPLDPALAVPWPVDPSQLLLSDKDAAGPSLAEAERLGILPRYEHCLELR
jgi:dTDP-4-dehydrorhamnose 3,5-epimerase